MTTNIQTFPGNVEVSSNLTVGTNALHVDTTTSNVGIGTASPGYKLDVHGTSNVGALTVTSGTFSGALVINGGPENDTTPALTIGGGFYDESDLYVLNTYNVNTGVGYAAKVIGVNIKNKVETDNTVQIRNNTGGLTSAGAIYLGSDDETAQGIFGVLGGTGTAGSTLAEHLTVKAGGNVGIGTTSPGYKLDVNGTLHAGNSYFDNVYIGGSTSRGLRSVSGNYGTVQTTGGGAGNWEGYSIEGRYVFMSADNNSCGIYNDLDNEWMVYCYRNSYTRLYYNGAQKLETTNTGVSIVGDIYASGNITAYSDIRKKENLQIIETPIEKVKKINGYTYEMDERRYTGLVAQEVLEVLPEAVVGDEENGYGLAYGNMAGLFVEAMKDMNSKLDDALARLSALENTLS